MSKTSVRWFAKHGERGWAGRRRGGSRGSIQVRQFTSPLHVNKFSGMSVDVMTCVERESRCQVSVWPTYDDSQVGWWQVGRWRGRVGTGSRGPTQVRQFTSPLHVNKFSGMSVVVMTCVEHESRCQVSVWPTYDDSQVGW